MATSTSTSFWPDLGPPIRTPLSIFKEQAAELGRSTQHLLEGEVDTLSSGSRFTHRFTIFAPTLDYRYRLLSVTHGVLLYPINAQDDAENSVTLLENEAEFTDWLRKVLSSDKTKRVLVSLMSQIKA